MTLLPPSVADERFLNIEQINERLQALNQDVILKIYFPQIVDQSALVHLAEQFNVAGVRGWDLADTEEKQRALIEDAIELNRRAGTPFAIIRALQAVGYPNVTVIENPPLTLDGSWSLDGEEILAGKKLAGFIVVLDSNEAPVSEGRIELLLAMIDEWKNARSALLDLRIGNTSLLQNLLFLDGTWQLDGDQELDGVKNP